MLSSYAEKSIIATLISNWYMHNDLFLIKIILYITGDIQDAAHAYGIEHLDCPSNNQSPRLACSE
jgi:hypothetical protein